MAAVRSPVRGLSSEDLETIRDALGAGRKPRVMFTEAAGQVAGQAGQVVALTDPELSDEWVVVRFGRDELPFSPADLAMPSKGAVAARRAEAKIAAGARAAPEPPAPDFKVVRETAKVSVPVPHQEENVPESPASTVEASTAPASADGTPANGRAARKATGKPAKVKAPATLTVTLAYAEGEWTVAATQGAKALAKPYLIRPSDALRMVGLLDVPGVHDAVEHILTTERAEAEQRADRLRAELAEIEAKLVGLRAVD